MITDSSWYDSEKVFSYVSVREEIAQFAERHKHRLTWNRNKYARELIYTSKASAEEIRRLITNLQNSCTSTKLYPSIAIILEKNSI